jgi:leader peptidase (prepilin peptidase)/N-methyltransferase
MTIISALFIFLLGAAIGSFLNVVIDRLPAERSLVAPPSACDHCQRKLSYLELVPIISYLFLRGRCQTCGEKIPLRVLAVEGGTGILFLVCWLRFGLSWETALYLIYGSALIALSVIDLEHKKIPNLIIYPLIVIALAMIPILHLDSPWQMLGGGLLGFGVLFLIAAVAPGAMGLGDVKLILFLGIAVGFPEIVLVLFLAFVLGGLVAGLLLALKKIGKKDSIAFGPFLSLAGFTTLLYGTQVLEWWLRRVGR